ncbi:MAG: hypothetical protein ABEJ46_05690, partial [Gemmatimonadota bacterium]
LEAFGDKPYIMLPKAEDEAWVVAPRFVPFQVGWLERHGERTDEAPSGLSELLSVLDYAEYGGAPLLGVNGVSIVCHGSSSPRAIANALGFAARSVRSGMVEHLAREMDRPAGAA